MNRERIILNSLSLVSPRMLPLRTLLADVRMDLPELTEGDLITCLRTLESKKQVVQVSDEDTTRIKITSAGQARLLE